MQLTRLDRWLREKFVHETHVYTLRLPEKVPAGVLIENLPDIPGRRFKHRFIARKGAAVEALISTLKENNQMFTTRVVDRHAWYVPIVAPKDRSITWWLIWLLLSAGGGLGLAHLGRTLWANDELRRNILEALDILKG